MQGPTGDTGATGANGNDGAPGVNTFHKVVSAADTSPTDTVTASCGGEVVTGGGFSAPVATVTVSAPSSDGHGWDVTFSGNVSSSVNAYAICVTGTIG